MTEPTILAAHAECDGTVTFTVNLSNPIDTAVTVDVSFGDITTGSGDFDHATQTVTFAANNPTRQSISVSISIDNVVEPNETFGISLGNVVGAGTRSVDMADTATGTIGDRDSAMLTIDDVTLNEGTGAGTTSFTFTVTLIGAVQGGFDVAYTTSDLSATTADGDYVDNDGTLTFAGTAGETQTITVLVNQDGKVETDETFFVNLTSVINAVITDSQGLGTITDNDPTPSLSINDVTVTEGVNGTAVFTLTLSNASSSPVSATYVTANQTAVAPGDYTAVSSTVLTFAPSQITQTISISIANDTVDDFTQETFAINLSNAVNAVFADTPGIGTILDND